MEKPKPIAEAVEEAAGEQLGVEQWDRPAIFRESVEAATANNLPYWSVLVLSGSIATLGLALNSSAVVIGAMLVAPLLAPVLGLALSLAVGDGRLAIQTGAVVLGSTLAVIAISALLTALLPFHTITLEISARTRPTTLDLAIAIFSGLVGAVVTVARRNRLSAAIPGVAISVALIPPLAVAGFGIGVGWDGDLIRGSLLLYGANLAGIVLSGMAVFLLVGMHRENVVETAQRWHQEGRSHGLAALVDRARWVRSLGVFHTPWARIGLIVTFVVALGIPLSETLAEIAREARVESAVANAAAAFNVPGRASILGRQVVRGREQTQVYLRVATTEWFGDEAREEFEREASAIAGEPVRLHLEQLPARGQDIEQLAALIPSESPRPVRPPPPPQSTRVGDMLSSARARVRQALEVISLPDDVAIAEVELATTMGGGSVLRIVYLAPDRLGAQAEQIIGRQLARALDLPDLRIRFTQISNAPQSVAGDGVMPDTARLAEVAELLQVYDRLGVEILVPQGRDAAIAGAAADWLSRHGVARESITVRQHPRAVQETQLRITAEEGELEQEPDGVL